MKNQTIPIYRGLLRIGDHLVYDTITKKQMVIRHENFNKASLPSRYVDGKAVFFANIDDKPYFMGVEELGAYAFSQYTHGVLTGFDLENGGSASITGSNFECTFDYAAGATYTEIASAMNTAKSGSYKSYVSFQALDNGIGVLMWSNVSVASGDLTLTVTNAVKADGTTVEGKVAWGSLSDFCNLTEIGYSAMDMKGDSGTGRLHLAQYKKYISTLASATTFGDEYSAFMNEDTFDALDGSGVDEQQALYDKYNGSYDAYATVCASLRMINFDVPRLTAETLRTGEDATKELAAVKIYDFDGETLLNAFPAAAAAYAYGITTSGYTTGFEAGCWHEVGVGELARVMRLATSRTDTLDADDLLNAAIVAGGGTAIVGSTSYALCGAYSVNGQLVFYGTTGHLNGNTGRFVSHRVRVALASEYQDL